MIVGAKRRFTRLWRIPALREKTLKKAKRYSIYKTKTFFKAINTDLRGADQNMEIKEDHKGLLKRMGLKEGDFKYFDSKYVSYEFDEEKGVRLYDPYYRTSYNEYIGIDGWSSWSCEKDTFMQDILIPAQKEAERREKISPRHTQKELAQSLKKKFGEKDTSDPK